MALSPSDLIVATFRDLSGNWIRSGLTTLGVFIGVVAINSTLNIDAITSTVIQQKLDARDNPYLTLWLYDPEGINSPPDIREEDLTQLQREVPEILDISTISYVDASQVQYRSQVVTRFESLGVSQNYQSTTGRKIVKGRFFDSSDFEDYLPVTIIDEILAEELFDDENPIGKDIFLDSTILTIIGVSESKNNFNYEQPVGALWVSEAFGHALQGQRSFGSPQIAIRDLANYEHIKNEIETQFQSTYSGFAVYFFSNAEDLYEEELQQRISARLLTCVGFLALVIGGVGIANITVATVIERTKEIGLRRAIGATSWEVMLQFITEAAMLSFIGGIGAIAAVHFATKTLTNTLFEAPYTFRIQDASLSLGAAFLVGVGSSYFPALRVTKIDVAQALRDE